MSALSISSIRRTGRVGEANASHSLPRRMYIVGDARDAGIAELRISQPRHRVIFIEALLGAGGRFDVPGDEGGADRRRDLLRKQGLPRAGLALDQERTLERHRRVYRSLQFVPCDVGLRAFKTHPRSIPGFD
jgi:hypothetical protein